MMTIRNILENLKLKNNFIDVTRSSNFTNPSASAYNEVDFNTVISSRGNLLTLSNGKIKVGAGVDFVVVSGKIHFTCAGYAVGG